METPLNGRFDPETIARCAALLRGGGVAVLPTDTIYGFHCAAAIPRAVGRIRRLKGREAGGFILLASSLEMAARLVSRWPGRSREILARLWPGRVTAILPASRSVDAALSPGGRVAVRVPRQAALAACIRETGLPLVSTSVNRKGEAPMTRIAEIRATFPGLDAYIGRNGPGPRIPSTVLDLTGPAPVVVREGASLDTVLAAVGKE
jgi:tRNA threonylcarbamoyl adenosine modification protein (Sua5/YciO/YrdC/YwlC family)